MATLASGRAVLSLRAAGDPQRAAETASICGLRREMPVRCLCRRPVPASTAGQADVRNLRQPVCAEAERCSILLAGLQANRLPPPSPGSMTALVAFVLLYLLLRSRLVMAIIGLVIIAAIVQSSGG